mmetsp:Transcript_150495/g.265608  ORF Transcript_150495/g.265608 Transcript_150495/m.265608 type:complete len:261 (-) Transcript_150495:112-894(-)
MSSHSRVCSHEVCIRLKSITWCLFVLLLVQDAEIVQAMGRSPGLNMEPPPQSTKYSPLSKASGRGLGFHAPQLSWGISVPTSFWKASSTPAGVARLRGASSNSSHKHEQLTGVAPKFQFVSLHWRRSLKMPTFIADVNIMSGQIWVMFMSLVLVLWLVQTLRHGLKSLHNFTDSRVGNPVHAVAKRLQRVKKPSQHSEQMQCLISELECAVREGDARLPQGLQKGKKDISNEIGLQTMTRVEHARQLKAFGPYLEVAGES